MWGVHLSFTLSLQAKNLPFQQILSTVDFFYLLDCLTITGLDRTGKSAQFELPGKFMKVSYNDSLSD